MNEKKIKARVAVTLGKGWRDLTAHRIVPGSHLIATEDRQLSGYFCSREFSQPMATASSCDQGCTLVPVGKQILLLKMKMINLKVWVSRLCVLRALPSQSCAVATEVKAELQPWRR